MIDIVAYIIIMCGDRVKPRIIWCRTAIYSIPVKPCERRTSHYVIHRHIEYYRDAHGMGFINKCLKVIFRSVIFIKRHMEIGIISPAVITFELRNGQKLNGIYSKVLKIIYCVGKGFIIMGCKEIRSEEHTSELQ